MSALASTARLIRPLVPRDPREEHRVASPLELLTDLCVVVAVAQAATGLHHGLVAAHPGESVLGFAMAFFAITWAWLTFTWFGSAYDNDDVVYRLLTILQIVGVLVLAAGIHGVFEGHFGGPVIGYVIMRVGLIVQWLRASRHDPARRTTCLRYAIGTAVVQVGWIAFALTLAHDHELRLLGFAALVVAELAVPVFAERAGITPWHPHHIAERYSLFFIIVLGETILSATVAIQTAFEPGGHAQAAVVMLMVSGVLIVFSLWWTYFAYEASDALADIQGISNLRAYGWGFGHYLIFASAAAVGAGLAARVEYWTHPEEVSARITAAAITVPVAILLVAMWLIQLRSSVGSRRQAAPVFGAVLVVAASTFLPWTELVTGLVLAAFVAVQVTRSAGEAGRTAQASL